MFWFTSRATIAKLPRCLSRLTRKRASSLPMTWAKSAPPVSSRIFLSLSPQDREDQLLQRLLGQDGRVHLLDDAAEPHHPRQAGLQVQVGALVQHDGAEELVDLRLAGHGGGDLQPRLRRVDAGSARTVPAGGGGEVGACADSARGAGDSSCVSMSSVTVRRAGPRGSMSTGTGTPRCGQVRLRLRDRVLVVVEDAGGERRIGAGLERLPQVLGVTGPAAGDDRDVHRRRDRFEHRQVVAVLGAVGVHRGQDDLAGPEFLDPLAPRRPLPARSARGRR